MVARLSSIRVHTSADTDVLRARLDGLTIRDAHRLAPQGRPACGAAAIRRRSSVSTRRSRRPRSASRARRAAVPDVNYPPELPVSARREDLLRGDPRPPGRGRRGRDRLRQDDPAARRSASSSAAASAARSRHTQPRRLAARTVAERIAEELRVPLGERGRLRGALQRPLGEDTLRPAHDRRPAAGRDPARPAAAPLRHDHRRRGARAVSLNIDFLLGYLKRILPRRPDLKLIITSATIDPERFAAHFDDAPVVEVSGRTYPVEVALPAGRTRTADQVEAIGDAVEELLRERPGRRARLPQRRARDPRHRRRAARAAWRTTSRSCRCTRACRRAEQQRVFQPHRGRAHRAGDERRRDVADRPRHPLRGRSRARRASAATARA